VFVLLETMGKAAIPGWARDALAPWVGDSARRDVT
jgi:hypothetical protein